MPNDLPTILEISRRRVAGLLRRFCDDPADRNCGGFVDAATGWADSRNSIYEVQYLFAAYLYPDFPETYGSAVLLDQLRQHLGFMQRRQHPDGTISLDAGGMGGSNEVGFTLPMVVETWRRVERSNLPGRDEILQVLGDYLQRGAAAIRRYFPYTSNHRWTAHIGPLAAVHSLFPNPSNTARIEEYLSDGIDIDVDGLYYEERSPNYNNVGNWGLLYLVDYWGRRDLLKLIERNLWLSLAMRQPNDEAETLYSHRQDRGSRNRSWGSYAIFKRLAAETGDGTFATAADHYLPTADIGTFFPLRYLFDDRRLAEENIPRKPLPEQAEIRLAECPIYRYRNGQFAVTVAADAGGHFWDVTQGTWGGLQRADAFMSVHCGSAIIDAVKIRWASGVGGFRPERIEYEGENDLRLSYGDPGWEHVAHYRPRAKWGPRHVDGLQEAEVRLTRQPDDSLRLQVEIGGWVDNLINLHFLLRENCALQTPDEASLPLAAGGKTFTSAEGRHTLTGPDGSRIIIQALPRSEHQLYLGDWRTITGESEVRCHRLVIGLITPVKLDLLLVMQPAAQNQSYRPVPR